MRIITFLLSIILLGASPIVRAAEPNATEPAVTNTQPGATEQPVAKEPPITKEQVLDAIAVLETNAASTGGVAALNVIIRFAKESDDVKVKLNPETMPWMSSKILLQDAPARKILLAAYLGGNIRAQLKSQKMTDDLYQAWTMAINVYHQIQQRRPAVVVPEIDALIAKQQKGELKTYALEMQNKQTTETQGKESKP